MSRRYSERVGGDKMFCGEAEKYHFSLADNVLYSIDTSFRFTSISPNIERILGYRPEELVGRSFQDLPLVDPDDLCKAVSDSIRLFSGEKISSSTYRFITKDGLIKFGEITGEPFLKDGEIEGYIAVARDVTEYKKVEQALKESEKRYRLLAENARDVIWVLDEELKYQYISPSVKKLRGYTCDEVMNMSLDKVLTAESYQKVIALFTEGHEQERNGKIHGHDWSTTLELELICKDGSTVWTEVNVSIIYDETGKATGLLGITRDISERKRAEEALMKSEANYRQLFDNSPAAIYRVDFKNGRFLKANDVFCEYFGCSQEEIISLSPYDILTEESKKLFLERVGKMALGVEVSKTVEYEIVDKKGRRRCVQLHNKNIYDAEGHVVASDVVAHDITERKRAEDALRASEERFKQVAENAGEWIWEVDAQGVYRFSSSIVERMLGYSPDELIGVKHFYDFFAPDVREELKTRALAAFNKKEPFKNFINPNLHKDGRIILLETSGTPVLDEKGNLIGYRGTDTDITLRKQAEAALRESEEKYRLLVDNTHEAIFIAQDGMFKFVNPGFIELMGYSGEELTSKPFDVFIYPEDRDMALDQHRKRLNRENISEIYSFRIVTKSGEVRWVEIHATLLSWKGRKASLGFLTDITDRRQAEGALRERQARLDSIFRVASTGIGVIEDRIFVDVNDRFCEITGYAREELIGKSTRMLYISQNDYEVAGDHASREIQEHGLSSREIQLRRKDGYIIDVLLGTTQIIPGDSSAGFTVTILDITDRKRAEEELKKHRDSLNELVKERTEELMKANEKLLMEIEVRKRSEAALKSRELELEEGQRALKETNIALKVLLEQRDEVKDDIEKNIVSNIHTSIGLHIDKLKTTGLSEDQSKCVADIEMHLKKISSSFIRDLSSDSFGLSPSEIKVAALIKEGKSSKEIAELLNVSLHAVLFHRNNIRTKIGLKNSKVNMMTYLQSFDRENSAQFTERHV